MNAAPAHAGTRPRCHGAVALRAYAIAAEGLGVEENLAWLLARGVCVTVCRSNGRRSA